MKYTYNLTPKQLEKGKKYITSIPPRGKRMLSLIGWMIEQGNIAEAVKKRFDKLPKKDRTEIALRDMVFAEYAFYMESSHGIPHDITYEWIEEKLNGK